MSHQLLKIFVVKYQKLSRKKTRQIALKNISKVKMVNIKLKIFRCTIVSRIMMLLKDISKVCKRSVSQISWNPDELKI